jgi:hypothetical protein
MKSIQTLQNNSREVFCASNRSGPRRRKPSKLQADKAHYHVGLRNWLRERGIAVRIARKGIDHKRAPLDQFGYGGVPLQLGRRGSTRRCC